MCVCVCVFANVQSLPQRDAVTNKEKATSCRLLQGSAGCSLMAVS